MSGRGSNKPSPKDAGRAAQHPAKGPQKAVNNNAPKSNTPGSTGIGRGVPTGSFHNMAFAGGIGRGTPIQKHFQVDHKQKNHLDHLHQELHKMKKQQAEAEQKERQLAESLKSKQDNLVLVKHDLEDLELKKSKTENTKQVEKIIATVRLDMQTATQAITKLEAELAQQKKAVEQFKSKIASYELESTNEKKKIDSNREEFYSSLVSAAVPTPTLKSVVVEPVVQELPFRVELETVDRLLRILDKQLGLNKKEKKPKETPAGRKAPNNKKGEAKKGGPTDNKEAVESKVETDKTESGDKVETPEKVEASEPEASKEPEEPAKKDEETPKTEEETPKTEEETPKPEETPKKEEPVVEKKPPAPKTFNYNYDTILLFESQSCVVPKTEAEALETKQALERRKEFYTNLRNSVAPPKKEASPSVKKEVPPAKTEVVVPKSDDPIPEKETETLSDEKVEQTEKPTPVEEQGDEAPSADAPVGTDSLVTETEAEAS